MLPLSDGQFVRGRSGSETGNSLPSMSCITRGTTQSSASAGSSHARTAPSATSRAHSASSAAKALFAHEPGADPRTSKMQPILDDLAFGNALEEQSRAHT